MEESQGVHGAHTLHAVQDVGVNKSQGALAERWMADALRAAKDVEVDAGTVIRKGPISLLSALCTFNLDHCSMAIQ